MKEYDDVKCIACGDEGCEYCKEDSELIVAVTGPTPEIAICRAVVAMKGG